MMNFPTKSCFVFNEDRRRQGGWLKVSLVCLVWGLALEFLAGLEGQDVFTASSGCTHWVKSLGLWHRNCSQGVVSSYFMATSLWQDIRTRKQEKSEPWNLARHLNLRYSVLHLTKNFFKADWIWLERPEKVQKLIVSRCDCETIYILFWQTKLCLQFHQLLMGACGKF